MRKGDWDKDKLKNPGKQMRSVWYISSTPKSEKKYGKHPTRKPLSLLNRVILASTNKGDLILDPFNGSGTTGLSALKNKRKYIGIDNNREYLEISRSRMCNDIEK